MITGNIRHYEHIIRRESGKLRVGEEIKGVFVVLLMSDECSDVVENGGGEEESALPGAEVVKLMELIEDG